MKYFIISFTAFTITHTWYNKWQQQQQQKQQEEYQEDENWNNNSLTNYHSTYSRFFALSPLPFKGKNLFGQNLTDFPS